MTIISLGRLEKIELRDAWIHEANDFTRWLAQEENIRLLGTTLNLELEVKLQEARVGPFRADILCRNIVDESLVLIENQLERTDHTHLGQLFTYAAGLNAVTVIWIASRFTEEHRAALDWLNTITHEGFHFFGLEIELWRIGNSAPAPKFNVVVQPNDWSKLVAEALSGDGTLTPNEQKCLEFWAELGTVIAEQKSFRKAPSPNHTGWIYYPTGRSNFGIYPAVSFTKNRVKVSFSIKVKNAYAYFQLLMKERAGIEAALGFEPEWLPKPGSKECSITANRTGDLSDPVQRRAIVEWMLKTIDAFDRVMRPRIKVLDIEEDIPMEMDSFEETGDET